MATKHYYVYIMSSRSRTLYTGLSNSLGRRVWEHKQGLVPGFTKRYTVHRLVYFEVYNDVKRAIEREKEIKAWRREKKVGLVNSVNPTWHDLAEEWVDRASQLNQKKQIPRLPPSRRGQTRNDTVGVGRRVG